MTVRCSLIDGETVQETGAARGDQVRLAAGPARMCGIPGAVPASLLVGMTELSYPGAVARPVVAGVVHAIRVRAAVRLGTGQDIVLVRCVADAVDDLVL